MNINIKRVTLAKELEDPYYLKDPKLLELYKKCLPPRDAYYYFPKGEEIIIHNLKKPNKSLRIIYYNVPYSDLEKKWINEFKELIKKHPETQVPDYFGDYMHLIFIYATSCNLDDSYQRLVNYIKFCKETFPILITPSSKLIEILNKGFVYVYGRDNRFRPIIICQCKVFQKFYKNYQCEEIVQASYFLCQFLVNNMLIPGQFESWIMIINLKGVSIVSLPEPIKKMIPGLSNYFLARLYKNYIIGLNFISRIIYKIACAFLDEVTVRKINVLDDDNDPALFEGIRRDNIEQQFGGTAPNLPVDPENGFFPPRMPSEHFIKDDENPKDILISEDEYINKYKNGEIPEECISPYLYDQIKAEENEKKNKENIEVLEKTEENTPKKTIKTHSRLKTINFEKSPLMKKNFSFLNKKKLEKESILLKKKEERNKIISFMNNDWNFQDELSYPQHYRFKSELNGENILNDINKFGEKRKNFISKISLVNTKKINNSLY